MSADRIRIWFIAIAAFAAVAISAWAEELNFGPPAAVEFIRENPETNLFFIISATPGNEAALAALLSDVSEWALPGERASALDLIDAFVVRTTGWQAAELTKDALVRQVWQVNSLLVGPYTRIIQGLDYGLKTFDLPAVANISQGPPAALMPMAMSTHEPINRATRLAAMNGFLPVLAIGNYADPNADSVGVVSPWCLPEEVICVGAADAQGTSLWERSALGDPTLPESWPDVVAHGIDTIGPMAGTKTADRKRRDEQNPEFRRLVPEAEWDQYSMRTGTSFAVANVSRAVSQLLVFLDGVRKQAPTISSNDLKFSLTFPAERVPNLLALQPKRLVGKLVPTEDGGLEIQYPIVPTWKVVKQLLLDTALPMEGYQPHEVGAGFVSPDYVEEQFGAFGIAQPAIAPLRVVE